MTNFVYHGLFREINF